MITGKVLTVGPTADIMTSKAKKEGENASSKRNQEPENSPSAGISTERREPSRPSPEVHLKGVGLARNKPRGRLI